MSAEQFLSVRQPKWEIYQFSGKKCWVFHKFLIILFVGRWIFIQQANIPEVQSIHILFMKTVFRYRIKHHICIMKTAYFFLKQKIKFLAMKRTITKILDISIWNCWRTGPRGPAHHLNYSSTIFVTVGGGDHAALKPHYSPTTSGRRYNMEISPFKYPGNMR